MLQAVEKAHRRVLHAVLVAGDDDAGRLAVVDVLALVVEHAAHGIQPLDDLPGDGCVVAEPDRAAEHQDVGRLHLRPQLRPAVVIPAVRGHVRVDAGRQVVVDRADRGDLDALRAHQGDRPVEEALRVAHLRAALQRAVDVDRREVAVVRHSSDRTPPFAAGSTMTGWFLRPRSSRSRSPRWR